ncbi:MAG: DUF4333 domain-containing protein [Thermoleophilaceae bacterium]|nr:DUF4333 domain-containing protein [Thermoleophilaceae bacterium]
MSPDRPAAPSRWLGRSLVAGALMAASVALTACGSEGSTILNTEKVERAIEQSALAQRKQTARVYCPSGVHQKKGVEFSCTAVVKRRRTRFVVTQSDGSGQVRYEGR